jgi:hypothetical protein
VDESLRARREAIGFTALEIAARADCPVEVVLRAEFGIEVPREGGLRGRLAAAYCMSAETYVRLALAAAERAIGA